MLWAALHFFNLSLDTATRGAAQSGPLAVASCAGTRATLIACNASAHAIGIRSGMSVAAAWALASDFHVAVRDEAAERAALDRIAAWAFEFTPAVSVAPPHGVLLEVEGSLKLFGGLNALRERIAHGLAQLGYAACIAFAPTPFAAQLFSRAGFETRIRHGDALRLELQKLPIESLGHDAEATSMLEKFGVRTVGECLKLPRAGVARRLGQKLLDDIDRALGTLPDPRAPFVPPPAFNASLTLPQPVEHSEALLFAARRLLGELCGWLVATGNGALGLTWTLAHEHHADTRLEMTLMAASRDSGHLLSVLRERLAQTGLPCPVSALALCTAQLQPLASRNLSFLAEAQQDGENAARLIERLRARLGEEAVFGLATCADHRPERAWRTCKPGKGAAPKVPPAFSTRPLWLLPAPQPLSEIHEIPQHEGHLTLLAGPERIESGWWDGSDVRRDYFVACNPSQSLLWIYRERDGRGAWYLHGIFG